MTIDSSTGQRSLILCPGQHDFTFNDISSLTTLLQNINFISNIINTKTGLRYFTGDNFLNYVSYMGCAPAIQFEPTENQADFCFVELHQYTHPKLIYSKKQSRQPHCPACNRPVNDWQQQISTTTILCERCQTTSNIERFNWRKMAGYACLFIEITDIFPKEAIPQQTLLDHLTENTGTDWQYFYSCN